MKLLKSLRIKDFSTIALVHNGGTQAWFSAWHDPSGILLDAESRSKVLTLVDRSALQAREYLERMADGDYRADPDADRFPVLEFDKPKAKERARATDAVTFDAIVEAQAATRQAGKTPRPVPDTSVRKYKRLAKEFASFRGSDDATAVTLAEAEEWGDSLLETAEVGNRTIAGKLTDLGTVINWGKHQRRHRDAMRVAEIISGQVELPTYVEKSADETSYTIEEAQRVLAAAQRETEVAQAMAAMAVSLCRASDHPRHHLWNTLAWQELLRRFQQPSSRMLSSFRPHRSGTMVRSDQNHAS